MARCSCARVALGLCFVSVAAAAQTFPDGESPLWTPLTRDGVALFDVEGDVQGGRDIVGTDTLPSAFVFSDGTFLYLQVRVDESVLASVFTPLAWACEFDTDGNWSNGYEFIASLDGVNNPDQVLLAENTTPLADQPGDTAETLISSSPIPPFARQVLASSSIATTPDYFVQWAVRLSAFPQVLGRPVRLVCGSSNTPLALGADLIGVGTTLTSLGSDALFCDAMGCHACNTAAFCGPTCQACTGTTPVCNTTTRTCRACGSDSDCGGATPACQASGSCGQCSASNSAACTGTTPVCNVSTGTCGACGSDSDCSGATPACQASSICGQCSASNSGACRGTTPVCNISTGTCRACSSDSDCGGATPACQASGSCGQCSASNAGACTGATPACDTSTATCVALAVDAGAPDAGPAEVDGGSGREDAGLPVDAGAAVDDGGIGDSGIPADPDAGLAADAGAPGVDGGAMADAGELGVDAGMTVDGTEPGTAGGCGCSGPDAWLGVWLGALALVRRRRLTR